jgi:hypothetical protein
MPRKSAPEAAKPVVKTPARCAASNVIPFPSAPVSAPEANAVNTRELCSIKTMTAYVAQNQNIGEETVRAFVEAEFDVGSIEQLRRADFEQVIEFLVDLRCDLLTN